MVNPWLEQAKIEEASSCELVPQRSSSWKEAASVELKSHQWNTKGMRMVHYDVVGMVGLSHKG